MKIVHFPWLVFLFTIPMGCAGFSGSTHPEVHVQLNDGQILVGEMTTQDFTLKTGFGTLKFSSRDAGELGPLEGKDMKQSDNLIRLWLRNGSEFIGGWERPSVTMTLAIGGQDVPVDVPIQKVKRLRFKGDEAWTDKPIYRVLTHTGDDFFVDASASRIHFSGELGTFKPFLSEIASLERVNPDGNDWKIRLKNGTCLNVSTDREQVELQPSLGPEKIELAWSLVSRMEPAHMAQPTSTAAAPEAAAPEYYRNDVQMQMKEAAAQSWK